MCIIRQLKRVVHSPVTTYQVTFSEDELILLRDVLQETKINDEGQALYDDFAGEVGSKPNRYRLDWIEDSFIISRI